MLQATAVPATRGAGNMAQQNPHEKPQTLTLNHVYGQHTDTAAGPRGQQIPMRSYELLKGHRSKPYG